ncbi:costars family protein ABRACL [Acipenser ruthenus]|nr:costars family protein ABRACL [Acipenser ruthenus]
MAGLSHFHTLPVELIGEPPASVLKAKRKKAELRLAEEMNVEHEVQLLVEEIRRLGSPNADGKISVKFGVLFRDDRCANLFEAMVGTLKAAKRKKIISFQGELLLQGVHDDVDVVLLQE